MYLTIHRNRYGGGGNYRSVVIRHLAQAHQARTWKPCTSGLPSPTGFDLKLSHFNFNKNLILAYFAVPMDKPLKFEYRMTWDTIHEDDILVLCVSPDGNHVASGGADGKLIIWHVSSGETVYRIDANSPVLSMTWLAQSPDRTSINCGLQSGILLEASLRAVSELRLDVDN